MGEKNICLHDGIGYFVGRWIMGHVLRLSVEHYATETACIHAIQSRRWMRRSAITS